MLRSHSAAPSKIPLALQCALSRTISHIHIDYQLSGPIDAVRIARSGTGTRRDELWKITCFELFIRASENNYLEFNFAPDGGWAYYSFDGYRIGMTSPETATVPPIAFHASDSAAQLSVTLDLTMLPEQFRAIPWRANLAAVIEEKDGHKSYWALAHPAGPPDFHDPACFVLEVGAPDRA